MSATGTFYVDCGDGGTLSQDTSDYGTLSGNTITRTGTSVTTYTCTWNSAGAHNVRFGGTATGYNTDASPAAAISFYKYSNGTQAKIASIDGSLGAMLPVVNGALPRFNSTFRDCTGITSIPSGLFSGIDTSSATNTSYMFNATFYGCTGITSIPSGLFSGITKIANYTFANTFYGCTGLTSLPQRLFSNITSILQTSTNAFMNTFNSCTNLSGYIPPSMFKTGGSASSNVWRNNTFYNTNLATSCPTGTKQYITGYESAWGGKVSCECGDGYWGDDITCTACTNKPTHSTYTGNAETNSCPYVCDTGYYGDTCTACTNKPTHSTYTGIAETSSCPYVCDTGYYGDACNACTNKPTHSTYTGNAETNSCPWQCDCGYENVNDECVPLNCAEGEAEFCNACVAPSFFVTTTSDATSLNFTMTAIGTFHVNCGDGGTLSQDTSNYGTISGNIIDRTSTGGKTTYTCTWASAGTHNVKFSGTATEYNTNTSIAAIAFNNNNGCSKIASIDGDLSTIFPTLGNNTSPRFYQTFYGCSNITSIPPYLFSGLTSANPSMFRQTFYNCTNLSGYIPPSTFAGLIANGHPNASMMWYNAFSGTALATSCPSGTEQYITGYEGSNTTIQWGGRVSCEPCTLGTYSDGTTTCTACTNKPANSSYTGNAGTNSCPWTCDTNYTEYSNTCHAMCPGAKTTLHSGTYSYPMFADKTNVPSPVLHIKENNTTCYVYLEADTGGEHGLKVRYNNATYHAIDPR